MNKKPKLTIAVSALNAIDSPGPGVAVIRALREAESFDVRIIGLAYESLEPGLYMHDLVDKTYQIPYPSSGIETILERLEYIHAQEKLDVIIPNFDAELYPYIRLEAQLKERGIHMCLPTMEQFEERHKTNLPEFGEKYGLLVPKSKVINDISEIYKLSSEFDYPLLVKGRYYDAYVAYNQDQVKTFFHRITAKWGLPVIIQEFVHGIEFNVTGLGDGTGRTVSAVPMRKQYITDKGKAWGGISISDKRMLALTDKFISGTKWKGGFELELMKNKDNDFYVLEINPRIPAWIYLAVGVGHNIPEALVKLAMGQKVEPLGEYAVGKMFIRYAWDMIVDMEEFQTISTTGEL
ncbi:MAG TPA: ATP-grasp domain-containing protein [Bacteroidales bacterium]|nr:ATP-grasp domain-containing protein [Bacteroidales bacterium]